MLYFQNLLIPGIHGAVVCDPPKLVVQRTQFFGVGGVSEIFGNIAERQMRIDIWIADPSFTTSNLLLTFLRDLGLGVGQWGQLDVRNSAVDDRYPDCTFEGFHMDDLGPMPDVAGLLAYTWYCVGKLVFTQLSQFTTPTLLSAEEQPEQVGHTLFHPGLVSGGSRGASPLFGRRVREHAAT